MALTGNELVIWAKDKVGTPYFYGSKMSVLTEAFMSRMCLQYPGTVTPAYIAKARRKKSVGKVNTDCSGLISSYTGKLLGSAQLYQQAYTRLSVDDYKNWANGVVVWRSGHVGVFFKQDGKYYVAEAKGIDYGTVISEFKPKNWTKGLTFSWMSYNYTENVVSNATWKGNNPYIEPTTLIKKGSKGTGAKWVQWELNEAGCLGKNGKPLTVDGDFGTNSEYALKQFQKSCKITCDGVCGAMTRKYLKQN